MRTNYTLAGVCRELPGVGVWVLPVPPPSGVVGHGGGREVEGVCGGAAIRPGAGRGYRTGAAWDDNQSSLLSAPWGVRAGWGQGRSPIPCPPPQGHPGMAGARSPPPPRPALFLQGHVPTRPIFMWAPSLPGGLLIPPETGRGIVDRAAISLEQASLGPAAAAGLRDTLSLP